MTHDISECMEIVNEVSERVLHNRHYPEIIRPRFTSLNYFIMSITVISYPVPVASGLQRTADSLRTERKRRVGAYMSRQTDRQLKIEYLIQSSEMIDVYLGDNEDRSEDGIVFIFLF